MGERAGDGREVEPQRERGQSAPPPVLTAHQGVDAAARAGREQRDQRLAQQDPARGEDGGQQGVDGHHAQEGVREVPVAHEAADDRVREEEGVRRERPQHQGRGDQWPPRPARAADGRKYGGRVAESERHGASRG
ncbi:hypothetical protein GCM10010302_14910 [Streptomyces polychromogenes]|uniref:Uncharacterized protein n=1 Tax=Streptomyces polychromogenes TaxID=67342 RepID=A0ABN0V7M6_9ACTN